MVENSPQNARNAPFKKNFLEEHAPKPSYQMIMLSILGVQFIFSFSMYS